MRLKDIAMQTYHNVKHRLAQFNDFAKSEHRVPLVKVLSRGFSAPTFESMFGVSRSMMARAKHMNTTNWMIVKREKASHRCRPKTSKLESICSMEVLQSHLQTKSGSRNCTCYHASSNELTTKYLLHFDAMAGIDGISDANAHPALRSNYAAAHILCTCWRSALA